LVHIDAHADTSDIVLGEKICHGTPFRRCVEEGLLDCKRVVQIGLRGSAYEADSYLWNREQVSYFFLSDPPLCAPCMGEVWDRVNCELDFADLELSTSLLLFLVSWSQLCLPGLHFHRCLFVELRCDSQQAFDRHRR